MKALCIVLYRNCCIHVQMIGLFKLFHIIAIILWVPLISLTMSFAVWMLSIESEYGGFGYFSSIS